MSPKPLRDAESVDFGARRSAQAKHAQRLVWPVHPALITRVGDTVTRDRNGLGRPHEGVDLFVPAGTEVVSAAPGRVEAVVDGRFSAKPRLRRAGLFVEVQGAQGRRYRYLHLADVKVVEGMILDAGDLVGSVAPAHTSGLGDAPHLHFEVRSRALHGQSYGAPINPLTLLPSRRS